MILLLNYVYDLVITGNSCSLIDELKVVLMNNFKMKDLGELKFFLRIKFARSTKRLVLSQKKYDLGMISHLGLFACKVVRIPMELNLNLTSKLYDEYLSINQHDLLL